MAYPLHKSVTMIGRHPTCDIVIPTTFDRVSREHAQIRREGRYFVLYDTSSAGTAVNGRRIRQQALQEGDRISLAGQVEFAFWNGALHGPGSTAGALARTRLEASPVYEPAYGPAYRVVPGPVVMTSKSRLTAALLAILLGDFGAHKFYLNRPAEAILYLLFSWTAIPGLVGLIEGISYLSMSDAEFAYKYGRW